MGPRGAVAVGSRTNTLSDAAVLAAVKGRNYYVDGGIYYQESYDDNNNVVYVVVPDPNN
jgi:hypothetical protein